MPVDTILIILGVFASAAGGAAAAVWWMFSRELYHLRAYIHNRDQDIVTKHEILLQSCQRAHARMDAHLEAHN